MDQRFHILLVDDDPDEFILLKDLINHLDSDPSSPRLDLDWVETYSAALEAFSRQEHDAYLVDYHLGAKTGLDLLREPAVQGCKAPIILLTGQGSYEVDMAAMQAGAADYLSKDEISADKLERAVRYAIEQKQAQDQLEQRVQERTRELAQANQELRSEVEQRKQAEAAYRESETRFRKLAETTSAAIFIVQDMQIRYANQASHFVTGYETGELINIKFWELASPSYQDILKSNGLGNPWADDIPARYELKILTKAKEERWLDVTAGKMDYEGQPAYVITAFDITDRDRAERELRRAKEELEIRVAERTVELSQANEWLEQVLSEVQKLSMTDELTGLYNRRALFEISEREIERSRRFGHTFSLLLMDIDYFKGINDEHGHVTGDEVLQILSEHLRQSLREMDIITRHGGDEFVVILPETSLEKAFEVAERFCNKVAEAPFETQHGLIKITVSIGVTEAPPDSESLDKLLEQADLALYLAKEKGRNRVERY